MHDMHTCRLFISIGGDSKLIEEKITNGEDEKKNVSVSEGTAVNGSENIKIDIITFMKTPISLNQTC